jgi:WD40 repeat protein
MRIIVVIALILGHSTNLFSQGLEHTTDNGTVYVGGKSHSKQIFTDQNGTTYKLSNFKNWENIRDLYLSPDQKYLIVYHRADKERFHRITLYNLTTLETTSNTAPGMNCRGVKWLSDRILFITGTTGSGTIIFAYDYKLTKLFKTGGGRLYIDIENTIFIRYPTFSADDGIFSVFNLKTGDKVSEFNFYEAVKENYICMSVSYLGDGTYQFVLQTLETSKTATVTKFLAND